VRVGTVLLTHAAAVAPVAGVRSPDVLGLWLWGSSEAGALHDGLSRVWVGFGACAAVSAGGIVCQWQQALRQQWQQ
jgi:hypothetical protein